MKYIFILMKHIPDDFSSTTAYSILLSEQGSSVFGHFILKGCKSYDQTVISIIYILT